MSALAVNDPELFNLIREEDRRQRECIELIASENFTSQTVMECLGSCLTNKYAEGYPGERYYGGTEVIDKIERLCQTRALTAYSLDPAEWGVNVQPYSGSPANFAVYTALLRPHDRIMGLDLPSGGHLTHGFSTLVVGADGKKERKNISASSIYFESLPYSVSPETGLLDYDEIQRLATLYKPRLIICGGSAYPREWNYEKFRAIADSVGAYLMCDMAHISGLVAAGEAATPFPWCDIVTTTTHKSLRGPRAGMIFYRKQYEKQINSAVFPALQGGPHVNQIAALAAQLGEVATPRFKHYAACVKSNAAMLADNLLGIDSRIKLVTGGTDNHLLLIDLKPFGLTGGKLQYLCDKVNITLNKNSIPGDGLIATGVRIGTPAMTTRGAGEVNFMEISKMIYDTILLAEKINKSSKSNKLQSFIEEVGKYAAEVEGIKARVVKFAKEFYMPASPLHILSNGN